jgi:hypothetical protein
MNERTSSSMTQQVSGRDSRPTKDHPNFGAGARATARYWKAWGAGPGAHARHGPPGFCEGARVGATRPKHAPAMECMVSPGGEYPAAGVERQAGRWGRGLMAGSITLAPYGGNRRRRRSGGLQRRRGVKQSCTAIPAFVLSPRALRDRILCLIPTPLFRNPHASLPQL